MIICECGRIHTNNNGPKGKRLQALIAAIFAVKGDFQIAELAEKVSAPYSRVSGVLSQMRRAGYVVVSGAAIRASGKGTCYTYKVVRQQGK